VTCSLVEHFEGLRDLHVVTNDVGHVQEALAAWAPGVRASVSPDAEWLSRSELELPGWYRQQLIKLRAYRFCGTAMFTNLGADTVLLRAVRPEDLVHGGEPVLWFTRHRLPDVHWWYERARVRAIGGLLGVRPVRARRHVDFINDFFTFDADTLRRLEAYLCRRFGPDPYTTLLRGLTSSPRDQRRFGEWTLYCTYVLDVERRTPRLRDTSSGFLTQIHTARALRRFRYDSSVVHVVPKDLDAGAILARVADVGPGARR
jgi:hypothetical protein